MPGLSQRIQLEGADVIQQQLDRIASVGQNAFGKLQQSAAQVAPALTAVETGAKRVADQVTETGQKAGAAFSQLGTNATNASNTITTSVRGVVSPLQATGVATRELGGHFDNTGRSAVAFGTVLRAVGRATGEHELSQLGGTVRLLGRYFAIAAPFLLIAGLAKLASSAAENTTKLADLAAKLQQSTADLNHLREVAAGAGTPFDKLASGFERLRGTMEKAAAAEAEVARAREAFNRASEESVRLDGEAARSRAEQARLDQQLAAAERQLGDATAKNATIFGQLGISVTDASGRLIPLPQILQKLAQVLPNVTDAAERQRLEWQLFADLQDRKVVKALFAGADALNQLQKAGQQFVNPITDDTIAKADKFSASEQHVADNAIKMKDSLGGTTIPFFDALLQKIQDAINGFGKLLGLEQQAAAPDLSGGVGQMQLMNPGDVGFAGGGAVRGPGTSTSDSILARLSSGEYVVRAAAVQHWGVGMMHAINNMRSFAAGGLVDNLPRFAAGGPVSSPGAGLHPITLQLGRDTVSGLLAPPDVADRLVQVATSQRIRRAGRRPGYMGGGT